MRSAFLAAAVVLLPGPVVTIANQSQSEQETGLLHVPHWPIAVNSDEDFRLPTSGVRRGIGTLADPYIIEGWEFLGPSMSGMWPAGLLLRDTAAHVVIRNNIFRSINGGAGTVLINTTNVTFLDNQMIGLSSGLVAHESHTLIVARNLITAAVPLFVFNSSEIVARYNHVSCKEFSLGPGIEFVDVQRAELNMNEVSCAEGPGIVLTNSSDSTVEGNTVSRSTGGIAATWARDLVVRGNVLIANKGTSLDLRLIARFEVRGNDVREGRGAGVYLGLPASIGDGNVFENNQIVGTRHPFEFMGYPAPFNLKMTGNTVDGLPIMVFQHQNSSRLDGTGVTAAYLLFIECNDTEVTGWRMTTDTSAPFQVIRSSSMWVHDNVLAGGGGAKIVFGANNSFDHNVLEDIRGPGLTVASPNSTIWHNRINSRNAGIEFRVFSNEGLEWATGTSSSVIGNVVQSVGRPLFLQDVSDVVVTSNDLSGSEVGIHGSPGVVMRQNRLEGHLYGAQSGWPMVDFGPVDARWNWWGSPSGPNGHSIPPGHSVAIWDSPWLTTDPGQPSGF